MHCATGEEGGSCGGDNCFDAFGLDVALNADWTTVQVPFSAVVQEGWGQSKTFDPKAILGLAFEDLNTGSWDFSIDDLSFYGANKLLVSRVEAADFPGGPRPAWTYGHDAVGRLQTITDPVGRVVTYGYDARNRLTSVTYADGSTETVTYGSGIDANLVTGRTDRNGNRHPFAITWATRDDVSGGILVRGVGLNSELIRGTMENTDVYRVMYRTVFGRSPD